MPAHCPYHPRILALPALCRSNAGTNAYRTGPLAQQQTEDIIAIVESNVIGVMLGGWVGALVGGVGGVGGCAVRPVFGCSGISRAESTACLPACRQPPGAHHPPPVQGARRRFA
jgi:hypothetical protein